MVREAPPQQAPPPRQSPYPAEKARGGRIVLRSTTQRAIFVAGLAGAVLLVLILWLLAASW